MTPLSSWPSRLNASPRSRSPSIVVQTALTLRTRLILRPGRRSWTAGGHPSGSSAETLASPHESLLFRPLDEEWHANLHPPFEPRRAGHAVPARQNSAARVEVAVSASDSSWEPLAISARLC